MDDAWVTKLVLEVMGIFCLPTSKPTPSLNTASKLNLEGTLNLTPLVSKFNSFSTNETRYIMDSRMKLMLGVLVEMNWESKYCRLQRVVGYSFR